LQVAFFVFFHKSFPPVIVMVLEQVPGSRVQMLITGMTEFHPVNLARLKTDRCRALIFSFKRAFTGNSVGCCGPNALNKRSCSPRFLQQEPTEGFACHNVWLQINVKLFVVFLCKYTACFTFPGGS